MKTKNSWEIALTASEKQELADARLARDASGKVLRNLIKKLQDRCVRRIMRRKEKT
jgi:hypothetical protein